MRATVGSCAGAPEDALMKAPEPEESGIRYHTLSLCPLSTHHLHRVITITDLMSPMTLLIVVHQILITACEADAITVPFHK